ncbi:hypothetical protein Aduo_002659 [Ancylostoma duodenale]
MSLSFWFRISAVLQWFARSSFAAFPLEQVLVAAHSALEMAPCKEESAEVGQRAFAQIDGGSNISMSSVALIAELAQCPAI